MRHAHRPLLPFLLLGVFLLSQQCNLASGQTCVIPEPPCSPRCEKENGGTREGAPTYDDGDAVGTGSLVSNVTEPTVSVSTVPQRPNIRRIVIHAGFYQLRQVGYCQRVCAVGCTGSVVNYEWERYYYLLPPITVYNTGNLPIQYPGLRLVDFERDDLGNLIRLEYELDLSQVLPGTTPLLLTWGPFIASIFPGNSEEFQPQIHIPIPLNGSGDPTGQVPRSLVSNPAPPELQCGGPDVTPPAETNCQAADPLIIYNGNYYHQALDLAVAGLMPIRIVRTYYSGKNRFVGPFGIGSHLAAYNYRLQVPKDASGRVILTPGTMVAFDPGNGGLIHFTKSDDGNVFTNNAALGTTGDALVLHVNGRGDLAGATYTTLEKTRLVFDANGFLAHSEDRFGNGVDLLRDTHSKLLAIVELSTGRRVRFTYNSDGLISQVSDHTGRKARYTYSPAKELLTVTDMDGQTMTYTWNADHRIVSKTDYKGKVRMTNQYGSTGAVIKQTLADGGVFTLQAPSALERKVTDPNGHVTTYRYNDQGLVVQTTDALGNTAQVTYAPNLFTRQTTERFLETTDPLGRVLRIDLNDNNLPTLWTDPLGQQTSITYDTRHPEKPKRVIDPQGRRASFTYDAAGNLVEAKNHVGNSLHFTYNDKGQVLTATNALSHTTRFAYDRRHELAGRTNPSGHTTHFKHDNRGRLIQVIAPEGNATSFRYDILGQLVAVTNALGDTVTSDYDANGNLISQKNPRGLVTRYAYDSKDRLRRVTNPAGETYQYVYDAADRLVAVTDAKEQAADYTYDPADRLIHVRFGDGTEYGYTYDAAGQLLSVTDGVSQWQYAYDLLGRVTVATSPQGKVSYHYDASSNLVRMSSPQYGIVNYTYDALDHLTAVSKDGATYRFTYDAVGRRTGLKRPNGIASAYTYDAAGRLVALNHRNNTESLERHRYRYDANGNITRYFTTIHFFSAKW